MYAVISLSDIPGLISHDEQYASAILTLMFIYPNTLGYVLWQMANHTPNDGIHNLTIIWTIRPLLCYVHNLYPLMLISVAWCALSSISFSWRQTICAGIVSLNLTKYNWENRAFYRTHFQYQGPVVSIYGSPFNGKGKTFSARRIHTDSR